MHIYIHVHNVLIYNTLSDVGRIAGIDVGTGIHHDHRQQPTAKYYKLSHFLNEALEKK